MNSRTRDEWLDDLDFAGGGNWSASTKVLSILAFIGKVLVEILFTIKETNHAE